MAEFFVLQSKPKIMHKIIIMVIVLFGAIVLVWPENTPKVQVKQQRVDMTGSTGDFLKRYCNVAVSESKAFKIPASVILSVAATNSECYDHPSHHNLFNLPPDTNWEGEVITYATTEGGEHTLRKYDTAWGSFRDFSITVIDMTTAQGVETEGLTVEGWLKVLEGNGLCDAQAAMSVIEKYKLTLLDKVK